MFVEYLLYKRQVVDNNIDVFKACGSHSNNVVFSLFITVMIDDNVIVRKNVNFTSIEIYLDAFLHHLNTGTGTAKIRISSFLGMWIRWLFRFYCRNLSPLGENRPYNPTGQGDQPFFQGELPFLLRKKTFSQE